MKQCCRRENLISLPFYIVCSPLTGQPSFSTSAYDLALDIMASKGQSARRRAREIHYSDKLLKEGREVRSPPSYFKSCFHGKNICTCGVALILRVTYSHATVHYLHTVPTSCR